MENPFDIYLAPELSKFSNVSWINKFLNENVDVKLEKYNLPNNKEDFIKQFNSRKKIIDYLLGLDEEVKKNLSLLLSNWRNNGVYNKIEQFEKYRETNQNVTWSIMDIPVNFIYVGQAEPKLNYIFNRNHFKLVKIAKDPEIIRHEPYHKYPKNEGEIEYPICLGEEKRSNSEFIIFDGIHRAIQMAMNNEESIKLCYLDKITKVYLAD